MKIITVSGAHSQVGKTTLIESLLRRLNGWSCLKVTVLHKGNCPVGKICQGCLELSSRFFIVHDKRILEEEGKDTQRYLASGAKEVLWLRAKSYGLKEGLKKALLRFKGSAGLIIEGTSVLKYLNPDLAIFVRKKDSIFPVPATKNAGGIPHNVLSKGREKDSARYALKKADLIVTL